VRGLWLPDIESLEAISQDEETCAICLRMAEMSQTGQLVPLLHELERDAELDDETKATLTELASDASFLRAVEDYVRATSELH
jgi:hypothetical protein